MIRIFFGLEVSTVDIQHYSTVLGKSRGISAQLFPLKAARAGQAANGWSKKL